MTGHTARTLAAAAALTITAATALAGIPAGGVEAQTAGWHIVVYTVNDSSSDLPLGLDLDEMVNASRAGVDFTVYVDGSEASAPLYASDHIPSTGEAIVVEISDGVATVTQRLGELDSGSPDTLGWFVAQTLTAHPAAHTALVVWDHGLGWQGIAFDENVTSEGATSAPSYLDAAELGAAVEAGLTAAGREQLDLLILDACLMANYEIVSETHGVAAHLMASEELVPGLGLDYDAFDVFADPAADVNTIFGRLTDGFVNDVTTQSPDSADMMTLSLINLAQAPALDQAMAAFAAAAATDVAVDAQPYLQAATAGFRYGDTGEYWPGFLDLGEYLRRLDGLEGGVLAARDNLLATLDAAVVDQIGSPSYADATGLTVYFPIEPREYDARYDNQPTAQLWRPFLSAFYDAQAQVVLQTDVGFSSETLSIEPLGDGQYLIDAPVTADFSGSVELLAALPDASGQLTYFEADSGTVVDNNRVRAVLYPSLTTISDAVSTAVPYTRYVLENDGWHGYSQFTLQRADGSIANLNWDRRESNTGPFTIIDPNGTIVGYTPLAGDLAYPIVMAQPPGGQPERLATAPALDPNRPWTVVDDPIASGTQVFVELQLEDATGAVVDSLSQYFIVQ
jgi:Clostripain family